MNNGWQNLLSFDIISVRLLTLVVLDAIFWIVEGLLQGDEFMLNMHDQVDRFSWLVGCDIVWDRRLWLARWDVMLMCCIFSYHSYCRVIVNSNRHTDDFQCGFIRQYSGVKRVLLLQCSKSCMSAMSFFQVFSHHKRVPLLEIEISVVFVLWVFEKVHFFSISKMLWTCIDWVLLFSAFQCFIIVYDVVHSRSQILLHFQSSTSIPI